MADGDVLKISGGHQTFGAPSGVGGGGVTVTDGTTTVDPVTSIRFSAGTLTDLGSGIAGVTQTVVIQEALIAFDASGIESGNGHQVDITIPAGAYFRIEAIITEIWDQPGGLYIRVGDVAGAQLMKVAQYDPTDPSNIPTTYVARSATPYFGAESAGDLAGSLAATGFAIQESVVFVKFSEDDELATTGSARIVAIIFTPAS